MKKVIISSVVALAFSLALTVTVSAASSYTFAKYLTVGSSGADVSALQSFLVSGGYLTMPAGVSMGYFGQLTKAAVIAYQTAVGIVPQSGFVGPLTIAKLNLGTNVAMVPPASNNNGIPASFTCPPTWSCPTLTNTTTPPANTNTGTPTTITTVGVPGTLTVAKGSFTGNGTVVNDGQAVDMASFDLQAGASDQQVSSLSFDFNVRPWLYVASFSVVNANTGATIATVSGLTSANFTELTVGSDYRLSIPATLIVKAGTKSTVVLHAQFATANRASTNIYVTRAEVRSVDGTNVTTTQNIGTGIAPDGGLNLYANYGGQNNSNLVVTIDLNSPNTGIIQTNTGTTQTQNVLLGIFDLKSQNINSTLQSLTVGLSMTGIGSIGSTFANVQLKTGSTLLTSGTIASPSASTSNVTFTNFNLPLPMNTYVPVSVYVTVNGGVTGIVASTSLVANATNIAGIDANSNPLTVGSTGTLPSSNQTFILSGVSLSNLAWTISPTVTGGNYNRYPGQTSFTGSFTVTAGSNPVFINTNAATALALATSTGAGSISTTITNFTPSNGVQSYDTVGTAFQITPGSSRTFTINGSLVNNAASTTPAALVGVGATQVNFGTTAGATNLPINFNLQGLNSDFHAQVYLGGSN